jgi:hypothetical protein
MRTPTGGPLAGSRCRVAPPRRCASIQAFAAVSVRMAELGGRDLSIPRPRWSVGRVHFLRAHDIGKHQKINVCKPSLLLRVAPPGGQSNVVVSCRPLARR